MARATIKTEFSKIDGTPEKRFIWSIISDYDLKTGLCELIDNAIDAWVVGGKRRPLKINVALDVDRQLISVSDNAGGVKVDELRLLIVPGGSGRNPEAEVIGIFGVGSKRAGIALGERVEIRTRYRSQQSFQMDITQEWLESPDWNLPVYEIPDIDPNTTRVDISLPRDRFEKEDVAAIKTHLGETYAKFIGRDCEISLNDSSVKAELFNAWAFPPSYLPQSIEFSQAWDGHPPMKFSVSAGLIRDRDAERENYGVYFYCNARLVAKEIRVREVGYFITREAGVPHPDASLCRVIIELQGAARIMPWNSSKSGINFAHSTLKDVRPIIVELTSHYSSLSRRLKNEWDRRVFRYPTGKIIQLRTEDIVSEKKLNLPSLPRVNKPKIDKLKSANKNLIKSQPWTIGLIEAMGAVEIITRQKFDTKNRIALIVLDSNFEIALKEFIVNRRNLFPANKFNSEHITQLFKRRHQVIAAVAEKISIPDELIDKASYYYEMRNKLIHERASLLITDDQVDDYESVVESLLRLLFGVKFPR